MCLGTQPSVSVHINPVLVLESADSDLSTMHYKIRHTTLESCMSDDAADS